MRKQTCLTFIIFSFFLATITSCGGGNNKLQTTFSVNAILSEERPLTTDERNIATRICYAYQSKSKNFRTNGYLGKSFKFSGKKTDCQNNTINYNITATLGYDNYNNLIYSPPAMMDPSYRFYQKVQTDTSGYLAQVCTKILSNAEISNTTTSNGTKTQITFTRDGMDGFLLMYFVRQSDGIYKVDSGEKFQVRTQINFTTGQILGMDEFYSTQKVCSSYDKIKNSNFEQQFISL